MKPELDGVSRRLLGAADAFGPLVGHATGGAADA